MYRLMPFSRRALRAAATLALLAAPALHAQAACAPGAVTLRTGEPRLASFTPFPDDTIDMVFEREGTTRPLGTYVQHVEAARVGAARAWLFVQTATTQRGTGVDSIWVDARTWAPLRHVAATPQHRFDVAYRDGRAKGTVVFGADSTRERDDALPVGMFDYSVGSAAFGAAALCPGVAVRIPGYDPAGILRERDIVMRVLSAGTVTIGGAPREVWDVEADVGDRVVRMHVDPATGRQLDWSVTGPNGVTMRGTARH
jgi:hypothetical protein